MLAKMARAVTLILLAALHGCSGIVDGTSNDGGTGGDGGSGASARVRFFDDFYPTLLHPDYCLGSGDHWMGPVFAGNYHLDGYSWGGFQGLSPTAAVAPGTYMLRVLEQYADTCDARLDGFADLALPEPLADGGAYTISVSGDFQAASTNPPIARMFADELAPADGVGRLRVINLAEQQGTLNIARVNVNTPPGSDAQKPVPLFLGVQLYQIGAAPATGGAAGPSDAQGYVTLPDDFYFYYSLPVYLDGGDPNTPMVNLKYTDPVSLTGNWTYFFVSRDGVLAQTLCRDDGAQDGSKCE